MPCSSVGRAQSLVGFDLHTGMRSQVRALPRQRVFHGYLVYKILIYFCVNLSGGGLLLYHTFMSYDYFYLPAVRLAVLFVIIIGNFSCPP